MLTGDVALRELGEDEEDERRREKKLPLRRGSTAGGGGGSGSFLKGLWLFFTGGGGCTGCCWVFDPKIGIVAGALSCRLVMIYDMEMLDMDLQ